MDVAAECIVVGKDDLDDELMTEEQPSGGDTRTHVQKMSMEGDST